LISGNLEVWIPAYQGNDTSANENNVSKLRIAIRKKGFLQLFSLFSRKQPPLLGIDISSTTVKLIELSGENPHYRVESYAVLPLPQTAVSEKTFKDVNAIGEIIAQVIQRGNTSNKCAAVAVPSSSVITKMVHVPLLSEQEMETQIEIEASHFIPYPMDEVSLDFQVVGMNQEQDELADVLIVATRKENVNLRVDALEAAGLNAKLVDVESYAVERAGVLIAEQLSEYEDGQVIAIVDIGATMTTFKADKEIKSREKLGISGVLPTQYQKSHASSNSI